MYGANLPFSIKPNMRSPCWWRMVNAYDGRKRVHVVDGMVCFAKWVSHRSEETERTMNAALRDLLALLAEIVIDELVAEQAQAFSQIDSLDAPQLAPSDSSSEN
jgi:hypothetical protein